jgi:hypothetical protein
MRRLGTKREKSPPTVVAKPPPEAASRVSGGGPWGPTPFELPDPEGNHSSIMLVLVAAGAALAVLALFLTWFYLHIT